MSELWYSPRDGLPPLNVRVLVRWCGRQFEAARILRRGGRGHLWLTMTAWMRDPDLGRWVPRRAPVPVELPDDGLPGIAYDIGPDPDVWRPLRPECWAAPLPPPVKTIAPVMWSSRTGFAAVADAAAAELAREMEADREAAAAQAGADARESARALAWWRDPSRVTYSQPGAISLREAEARVSRAILTDGLNGFRSTAQEIRDSALAGVIDGGVDTELAERVTRFVPLPQDLSDYLTAFGWFARLSQAPGGGGAFRLTDPQLALVWRARGRSWRAVAEDLGVSDDTARRIFATGLVQVHRAANGWPLGPVSVAEQRAALREREIAG